MQDFTEDQAVTIRDNGKTVNGYVESICLHPPKVNVKIMEPGHRQHCLTVAFDADDVTPLEESGEPDGITGISREDLEGFAKDVDSKVSSFDGRVTALETLPSALSALQSRVDALEAQAKASAEPITDPPATGEEAQTA